MEAKRLVTAVLASSLLCFGLVAGTAGAVTGQLDPSFGNGGVASPALGSAYQHTPLDSARLPDGRTVVAGASGTEPWALLGMLRSDGSPDPAFGVSGAVETRDVSVWDAVAVQADEKIVVAGHTGTDGVIARFNPDGSPDAGFGTGGRYRFDAAPLRAEPTAEPSRIEVRASALRVLPDNRIRMAARFFHCRGGYCVNQLIAGTTPDGDPDPELGADGVVRLNLWVDDAVWMINDDGGLTGLTENLQEGEEYYSEIGFTRVRPDGSIDEPAGNTFALNSTIPLDGTISRLIRDPDGRYMVASGTAVLRVNADGTPDEEFGPDGKLWIDPQVAGFSLPGWPYLGFSGVLVDQKGRILLSGVVGGPSGSKLPASGVVMRLRPNGEPDPTFGAGGLTVAWRSKGKRMDGRTRLFSAGPDSVMIVGPGPHQSGLGVNLAVVGNGDAHWWSCGGHRADYIGTDGDDVVPSAHGAALVLGAGNDRVTGSRLDVCAGGGDDVIDVHTGGPGRVWAGAGNDRIKGSPQRDVFYGNYGNDRINGMGGPDLIRGGPGDDWLLGGGGDDLVYAMGGNDQVYGGSRDDRLLGGTGHDRLFGGNGFDRLIGGPGKDTLRAGPVPPSRFTDFFYRSDRFGLRLNRHGRKLRVNGTFRWRCEDEVGSTLEIHRTIPLRADGRFRYAHRDAGEYLSVENLEGRIRGRSIVGRFRFISSDSWIGGICSTGKRPVIFPLNQAWVGFRAKVRPRQKQMVRQ